MLDTIKKFKYLEPGKYRWGVERVRGRKCHQKK
jgi:hypothetical protein